MVHFIRNVHMVGKMHLIYVCVCMHMCICVGGFVEEFTVIINRLSNDHSYQSQFHTVGLSLVQGRKYNKRKKGDLCHLLELYYLWCS